VRGAWDLTPSSREGDWRLASSELGLAPCAPRLAKANLEWRLIVVCRDSQPGVTRRSLNCW